MNESRGEKNASRTDTQTQTHLAASAVMVGKVTTLDHKVWDDAVEAGTLVAKALLASAQGTEVLDCLGHGLAVQLNDNATSILAVNLDVKEHPVCHLGLQ